MKKKLLILPLTLLFIIIASGSSYFYICSQIKPVSKNNTDSVKFEVSYGDSSYLIIQKLYDYKLIKNQKICYFLARHPSLFKYLYTSTLNSENLILKSGSYRLSQSMSFNEILMELTSGHQEYIKVSIPEGLTISTTASILEQNNICNSSDFKNSCQKQSILSEYKIPAESCEGYLFPDTYFLTQQMDSDMVVRIMIDTFFNKIQAIPELSQKSPEDLHQTVILASIVEKEYKVEEEAPLIASVFKNRLRRNIGLYSCATIVYIITEILGKPHPDQVLISDTKIDNPYNTYKWAGLTPGPISNPGTVALDAATNTPKTKYYYFQVKDEAKGTHVFTSTFEEHIENH